MYKGLEAEALAKEYLQQQGLTWVTGRFHSRMGEIDLIMRDQATLVFVEVRFRQDRQFGTGLESISIHKQKKIWLTASYYLLKEKLHEKVPVRFDVVSIQGDKDEIIWMKDAFRL